MVSELDLRIYYVVHNLQYEIIPYSLPYPMIGNKVYKNMVQ